jgi:hypothetical protein
MVPWQDWSGRFKTKENVCNKNVDI